MREPSPQSRRELDRRGGPRSALRLVAPGEDPRVLSTDPDRFLRKPRWVASAIGFVALVALSVVGVRFITVEAWNTGDILPWFWNPIWVLVPWVVLGPLWGWWAWRQWLGARVRSGRAALATLETTGPPERGTLQWSFLNESPTGWHRIHARMMVETPTGESVFDDIRTPKRRPRVEPFMIGDPVWIWRSVDGWTFGQITGHGTDPTHSPADEPQPPSWESQHGGRTPAEITADMMRLAERYRAGEMTRAEHDAALHRLLHGED